MKDLDKTQVYDLRGITEEQAKELYDWLRDYDSGWTADYYIFYWDIRKYISIKYTDITRWFLSDRKPTTHISTLFESTYEQQLQESKSQLERYKKEVERLENESKPKVGDVCKFWNYFESDFVIGTLTGIADGDFPYLVGESGWFKHAKKLTEKEVIDLLFNKSC